MTIVTNPYPHNWSYQLNFKNGPFTDKRIRQAANYALNREDMKELLGGMMQEGYATVPPSAAYYGKPVLYKHNVAKAKELLKEAGCLPCKVTFAISTSGSGQMQPLPMNELVKSNMDEAGFQVTLKTMDWNALLDVGRGGVMKNPDIHGINISRQTQDPFNALVRHVWTGAFSPAGVNWGHYSSPKMDKYVEQIMAEFDPAKRLTLLTQMHEFIVGQRQHPARLRPIVPRPGRASAHRRLGPDAQHAAPVDLCRALCLRPAGRGDLHHLDLLQSRQ